MRRELNIWLRTRANYRVLEQDLIFKILLKLIQITDERGGGRESSPL